MMSKDVDFDAWYGVECGFISADGNATLRFNAVARGCPWQSMDQGGIGGQCCHKPSTLGAVGGTVI